MSLVFAGVCSHAPGITGRAHMADPDVRDRFYDAFRQMGDDLRAEKPDAVVIIAAEHFANFFMNNMPFDHGIMVPLNFLTPDYDIPVIPVNINCQGPPLAPLERAWAFGESMRQACEAMPERIAIIGTGGISHWPATPDSGKINEEWDLDFMDRWCRNDKDALLDDEAYNDLKVYADAGQGGFEIRTYLTVSAAAGGAQGVVHFCEPIPIFAVSCTVATYDLASV